MNPDSATIQTRGCVGTEMLAAASAQTIASKKNTAGRCQIWLIARKELSDRFRSGWIIVCVLVWLGAIGLTSFFGLLQIGRIGALGYERTVLTLLNLVQYLVPLLGLLLGHDLIVSENEEYTLRPILAGGVSRAKLLLGKFFGGCLTLATPLLLGFAIAGVVVGISAEDQAFGSFLRLAVSALALGIIFLALGLAISNFSRTRVQALVLALLTWGLVVFAFDLVALGWVTAVRAPAAAREIEVVCDATHVTSSADIHAEFENGGKPQASVAESPKTPSLGWLSLNPVDLFRAANLETQLGFKVPPLTMALVFTFWLASALGASLWKLRRIDL